MDIIVGAKNFELTPSLRTYVEGKVGKLQHFWKEIIRARVELTVEESLKTGARYLVTVTLEVPGPDIRVEEEAGEMHAAIDMAIPVLERLVEKVKGKSGRGDVHLMRRAHQKLVKWYDQFRNGGNQ